MSSAYPSSYAARSAAAYNNVNSNLNRNLRSPNNNTPRVGTFPSVQAHQSQNQNQNYNQDFAANTQSRLLNECSRRIQEQAYYMRRAMDEDDLPVALERATFMLSELGAGPNVSNNSKLDYSNPNVAVGSNKLSPKNYYELQMKAMDEMPNLEEFFLSLDVDDEAPVSNTPAPAAPNAGYFAGIVDMPVGNNSDAAETLDSPSQPDPLLELYETVQYCPRVLPRLYLQICAGTALLRSRANKNNNSGSISSQTSSISVMKDLMDHVKCVQSPIRGLFLRNYVLQIFKYPMKESLEDLYTYLLQNFVEMNQLWVRIQHLPSSRGNNIKPDKQERRKREKERNELRLLVGTNLVRLSQLDGMTPELYKEHILPPILEQVVTCKDALAQAYLMDCIIQVFPDDYHIETMSIFLEVLPKLKEKVNVRTIIQGMMERLSNYYNANTEALVSLETYENLSQCVQTISSTRTMAAQNPSGSKHSKPNHSEIIHLQTYLFQFSLQHFPDYFFHMDQILNQCADTLNVFCATAPMDDSAMADLEKLLTIPLEKLSLKVLELNSFGSLLEFLPWDKRKKVGKGLIQSVIADGRGLKDVEEMEGLLKIITPLLKDIPNHMRTGNDPVYATDEIDDDQNWVAKLVHLFHHDDTDVMFQMLNITSTYFAEAGKGRIENTSCSLVFATFKLVKKLYPLEFKKEFDEVEKALEKEKAEKAAKEKEEEAAKKKVEETAVEETEEELTKLEINGSDENETPEEEKSGDDEVNDGADEEVANEDKAKIDGVMEQKEEVPEVERAEPSLFDDPEPTTEVVLTDSFNRNITCRKIFLFLQKVVSTITQVNPELSFQLYLQVASLASSLASPIVPTKFSSISYEFIVQAFTVYGDEISDSKTQMRAMTAMIGTLLCSKCFSNAEFGALVTKAAQFSARLLKKPDQCKMVTTCSHLFFTGDEKDPNAYRNPQRVLECLQRSLKIADACTMASASNVHLFIDILDHYVFYFEKGTPLITDRFVSGLIALINEHLNGSGDQDALVHYQQILKYIQRKKANNTGNNQKFSKIAC